MGKSRAVAFLAIVTSAVSWLSPLSRTTYAVDFEWDNGTDPNDNFWGTQANWDPESSIPSAGDNIVLTGSFLSGDQTIELNGQRAIGRIEVDGATAGKYTFVNNGSGRLLLYANGDSLLTGAAGGSLQIDADVMFFVANNVTSRFHVPANGEPIVVNGDVVPSGCCGLGTMTFEMTSANLSFDPRIEVNGVISDSPGAGTQVLNLTAGNEDDAENHRGVVRVTGANTYTGKTIVNGAVLEFDSIGNVGGGPSGLGNPSLANATIRLGATDVSSSADVPGTLRYLGSVDAQTDRDLVLQGGGGNIAPEGFGGDEEDPVTSKLQWNGNVSALSGATSTLSLDGAHLVEGAHELNGIVSDGAGKVSLAVTNTTTWRVTALNDYTGTTTIERGTLEIEKLSDAGVASSIGAPVGSDATINLATTSQTAILRYVGMGDSTDRPLNLGRFPNIHSFGTGPLTFTAPAFTAASVSSGDLDLRGDYLGTNTVFSDIPDYPGAATMGLNIFGETTWELAGNNTFEGNVSLGQGTLSVSSDSNLGAGNAIEFLGGSFSGEKTLLITGNTFAGTSRTINLSGGNTESTLR